MRYADVIEIPTYDRPLHHDLATVDAVSDLVQAQQRKGDLYLRVSRGPDDVHTGSRHPESGYPLPGLACWPLVPEPWWPAGTSTWIARQLVSHSYLLSERAQAWVLTGPVVGRGADGEPLVAPANPVALVGHGAFLEAESVYAAWRCRDVR
ncbi:hypothetical protein ATJ97_1085 [Georgenia soli]|uniref:Uncharacterized protein n=1 Tax=Georgenia soli TaxID=638953 RepID=A0A2A9EJA0_9MICO|nr:DUF6098 family protein [Georgenia soli]PFG38601.1 hypothetical protein ATJ97_1085 [Georgenia soli]